ncbi:MAG: T9SS type A sorting domain-containing protein [Bacteroidota bacterium]
MKYLCKLIIVSSFLSFSLISVVQSQDRPEGKRIDLHQQIDRAYQEGKITLDQRVLYKFFPADTKGKLPDSDGIDYDQPLKCGTPATSDFHRYRSELSPATISQIESQLDSPTLQNSETHQSDDGYFTIHYETSGEHAVPPEDSDSDGVPDYVEEVAAAADSSYRHEVQRLGYTDPISSGQTYYIYVQNLNVYGLTSSNTTQPNSSYYCGNTDASTCIYVENDFTEGFPPNDDPEGDQIGAIKVTVAHEFKHAIQYEASEWQGETGNWLEMDATLMEEVVYDNVNDYYNYIASDNSIFNNPQRGFYPGSYAEITWALFFEEKFGSQFWVDVWETIKDNSFINMVDAITQQLGSADSYHRNYIESQLWHYASGDNATNQFGFEEAANYPSPSITDNFTGDNEIPDSDSLNTLSANYFDVAPSPFPGSVAFNLSELMNPRAGMGVLAFFDDGDVEPVILFDGQQQLVSYETDWQWEDVDKIGLVAANGSYQQQTQYAFAIQSIDPQVAQVEQNYPNPFNEQTTIRYSITQQRDVQLEVFDALGRKVTTLVDESQSRGIYNEQFDGRRYASGTYFYRLIIDGEVTTKKMTLIK